LRTSFVVCVAVIIVALACTVSGADPYLSLWQSETPETCPTNSWIGSSGMIYTPTARNLPPQAMVSSLHYVDTEPEEMDVISVNVGLTSNLEVGAARLSDAFGGTQSEVVANAKYNLDLGRWTENPETPEVAVGVWDIGNELNRAYYVVVTKDLAIQEEASVSNLRFSIGYADNEMNSDGALDGFFGGIEFVPLEDALVQLEYDGGDFNGGFRYHPNQWLSLEVASLDGDLGLGMNVHTGF